MQKHLTVGKFLLPALALMGVIAAADQASKWLMVEQLLSPDIHAGNPFFGWLITPQAVDFSAADFKTITLAPFLDLTMVWNQGISFGLFSGSAVPILLSVFATLVSLVIIACINKAQSRLLAGSLAMIAGGALSNVFDRIRFGAVIDFIDVHAGGLHWPAFNLADSCIVVGAGLIMLDTLMSERKTHHETAK